MWRIRRRLGAIKMQHMQKGGNAPVGTSRPRIAFTWTPIAGRGVEADVSAYLLTASGKVRGDRDMVFYNQTDGGAGGVRFHSGDGGAFDVDLDVLPEEIERIVFCLTIDEAQAKGHTLALIEGAAITVSDGAAGMMSFRPELVGATEAAMIFGEFYRRQGQWKFRAVGQGFTGGLAPLASSFGIDIAADDAPPQPAPVKSVQLAKLSMNEPGQTITLTPGADGFGSIVVTLNWSHGRSSHLSGAGGIDLDLGCLVEMQDGRKTAIQMLGGMTGAIDGPPFIVLTGDDRTGVVGETLQIDGAHWRDIKRVAVFCNIHDGAPDWRRTAGLASLTAPGQPPIEIQLSDGRNDCRICGIVLMENEGDLIKLTRLVEYVEDQRRLDERLGWGMRWQPASAK